MTTLTALVLPVIQAVCPNVHPITAPWRTPRPYVILQTIGGQVWDYEDNTPSDQQHTMLQVTAWADTDVAALALINSIEAALRAATTFNAWPDSRPRAEDAADLGRYGYAQDFSAHASTA